MSLEKKRQRTVCQLLSFLFLFVLSLQSVPALANPVPPPPNPSSIDERNVDLTSGGLVVESVDLAIGPSDYHGLHFARQYVGDGWRIADVPTVSGSTSNPIVSFEGRSIPFRTVSGAYVPVFADGSTLNSTRTTFTSSDGTVVQFGVAGYQYPMFEQTGTGGLGTQVTYPDGTTWTFSYNQASFTAVVPGCYVDQFGTPCRETYYVARLSSITSSTGYQIKLTYASNTVSDTPSFSTWSSITKATALNNAIEYCNPTALSCSFSNTWPQATFTVNSTVGLYTQFTGKTDPAGRQTTYTYTSGRLSGIRPPGAALDTVNYGYNTNGKVSSVTVAGNIWGYIYGAGQTTITSPSMETRWVQYSSNGLISYTSENYHYIYCQQGEGYCPEGLLKTVYFPESDELSYQYDNRGNPVLITRLGKQASGSMTTSAVYPATCTNQKTCNKPTSTTDERGKTTDYQWNSGNGKLDWVRAPSHDGVSARPETRYAYGSVYAWAKNASGTLVQSPAMSTLTSISQCRTGSAPSCVSTSDEKLTTIAYPTSGPSNAQPSSVTMKAGNNTLVEITTLTYNNLGQVLTIDGPLAGAGDTRRIRYDTVGQPLGQVAPAPGVDGLANMATKYTYDAWGNVSMIQTGSVADQSDTAWSAFSETSRATTSFDNYGRPVRQKTSSSGGATDYEVTDTIYDANGRVSCTIARMDPAQWGTVATVCAPSQVTGPNGPDRVTKTSYDSLNRIIQVRSAVGITGIEAADATYSYTANGKLRYLIDSKGRRTEYRYDGYDRLAKIVYPSLTEPSSYNDSTQANALATAGAGNESDNEQIAYDLPTDVNNRVYFTTRRGEQLALYRDNLGRTTKKVVPERSGLNRTNSRDVFYSYDLFGDLIAACFGNATATPEILTADCISYTFDALGRQLTETQALDGNLRTITSAYAGDNTRTQITHPDGTYFHYYRDNLGRNYYTTLNAAAPLFYPQRQTNGRLNQLYRYSTTTANWGMPSVPGYDGISRVTSVATDLAGSSYDFSSTFTYNPASQIVSQTRANDTYAWTGATPLSRSYAPNALNRYSAVNGAAHTYDSNGNLTSDGVNTFVYDVENRMVSRSGGGTTASLRYDPLGRLYEVVGSDTGTTRFLYDGDDLVGEYNSAGTLLRRYAHGDGSGDDPLVWFEGSGVTDAVRRYLYTDERGSIVAVTDSNGNLSAINSYDEYGIPDDWSTSLLATKGRFRYTGQAFIPEIGMYYYKARMYSPTLGRFMQTDPIGYADGMNTYWYAHNDPVNFFDSTGLDPAGGNGNWCDDHPASPGCPGGPPIPVVGDPCTLSRCVDAGSLQQAANHVGGVNQNLGNTATGGTSPQNDDNTIVVTAKRATRWYLDNVVDPYLNAVQAYTDFMTGPYTDFFRPCCFTAGTLVDTPSGPKAIETLKVGDLVISRDPKTDKTAIKPIVGITPAHERHIWKLTVSYKGDDGKWRDERYETTDDHPWRTAQNQWVVTASLKKGQLLAREHGTVVVAEVVNTGTTKLTYNLEIADFHTYFVGKAETWVHNSCPTPGQVRQWLSNRDFRNWFHKVYKAQQNIGGYNNRNSDMDPEDIEDAWMEWNERGRPKV